ncbi:uncharacterized protein [Miscanthus floridulus]|uniref:uncharacterized protein n=1 Tax=Miscanthus floridulus TaxID=154761 RepID=UPI0034574533
MSAAALSDEEILRRVRETVEGKLKSDGLTPIAMRPSWGYLSLGMRDVRASLPPIPEDTKRRAVNRAHAEAQKKKKDAEEAKRKRKIIEHEELEKRRRRQRQMDESEVGRSPLDYLPDIGETAPGASASSPALPGGGGEEVSGPAIVRPGAMADMPEARALGKCAVSPMGSTAEVEQVVAGATQLPPQRTEGVPESGEGRLALADTEAVPPPPAPSLQRRVAVPKRLHPRSSRKRKAEVPTLVPLKSLKVSTGSTTHQAVEAQDAIQRGGASARADLKELVAQEEVTGAAMERAGEEMSTPREAEACESDGAEAPSVAEATEGETEAPRTSEAEATEAGAPKTAEANVAGTGAPETTKAEVAGADVSAAKPAA